MSIHDGGNDKKNGGGWALIALAFALIAIFLLAYCILWLVKIIASKTQNDSIILWAEKWQNKSLRGVEYGLLVLVLILIVFVIILAFLYGMGLATLVLMPYLVYKLIYFIVWIKDRPLASKLWEKEKRFWWWVFLIGPVCKMFDTIFANWDFYWDEIGGLI